MQRFLASDVIYQDSFVGPAKRALADADVTGVQVPDRQFFLGGIRADQSSPTGAGQLIPGLQRTGLGRLLYACTEVWARFLLLNDPLVLDGVVRSAGHYCLVSTIDRDEDDCDEDGDRGDNQHGHGAFLRKLGFVRAQHDFGQDTDSEIAFQREFRVPVIPSDV
jgi:hypothetical protein